jgi:hypothetical protein
LLAQQGSGEHDTGGCAIAGGRPSLQHPDP